MSTTLNTAYKVQADLLESESNINIENGTLHVFDNELKVHLDNEIKTIKPSNYKVFTALLMQNGSDNPDSGYGFNLTTGVTYKIEANNGTADFTNVGSPNNEIGTSFIATGEIPNNWGEDTEISLSFNTGTPIATILENTIGNIWFTFQYAGEYYINSDSLFTDNKTAIFGGFYDVDSGVGFRFGNPGYDSNSTVFLRTNDGAPSNGILQNTTIEIRVYN